MRDHGRLVMGAGLQVDLKGGRGTGGKRLLRACCYYRCPCLGCGRWWTSRTGTARSFVVLALWRWGSGQVLSGRATRKLKQVWALGGTVPFTGHGAWLGHVSCTGTQAAGLRLRLSVAVRLHNGVLSL